LAVPLSSLGECLTIKHPNDGTQHLTRKERPAATTIIPADFHDEKAGGRLR